MKYLLLKLEGHIRMIVLILYGKYALPTPWSSSFSLDSFEFRSLELGTAMFHYMKKGNRVYEENTVCYQASLHLSSDSSIV